MTHLEFSFPATDGLQLFGRQWLPEGTAVGLLCLVHGFGEHSGRYHHVARAFNEAGVAVIAFDQRGHGRSAGKRGFTPSYDQSLVDIGTFIAEAQKRLGGVPTFLYGHSMGGNMVLNYTLRHKPKLQGVISTSPWLRLTTPPPTAVVTAARLISTVWRTFTITNKFEDNLLSNDPEVDVQYKGDPLVHGQMSGKLFFGVNLAGEWAIEHAAEFPLPLLLVHGEADPITSFAASLDFVGRAPTATTTFQAWPHLLHETHNETSPQKEEVITYNVAWVKGKC